MKKLSLLLAVALVICCVEGIHCTVETDKRTYRGHEPMEITVIVSSPSKINATVEVYGIKNLRDQYLLHMQKNVTLNPGTNYVNFSYTTPVCSQCAGLPPGEYFINSTILLHGVEVASGCARVNLE